MMRSETLTRYELASLTKRMNVLLDNSNLRPGDYVTLVDDEDEDDQPRWLVMAKHETLQRRSIKRGWDNNI